MRRLLVAFAMLLAARGRPAAGQAAPSTGGALQVFLLTIGQGGAVWEKFGHNALWFRDPSTGLDVAYNWGVFDFNQPHFLQRFLSGDTKYWVEPYPGSALVDWYRRSDRTITLQRLNFTPAQAQRALRYAEWNAREENKYYRYDYFRDNCSTRVRDVIDFALGGAVKAQTASVRVPQTYRGESVRLVDDLKLTQLGIFTALGEPADRRLSRWETFFIPMSMRDGLRLVRVGGGPLVVQERVLYESRTYRERESVPRLWLAYLVVGLLIGAEFLAVGRVASRSPLTERVFRAEVALWALVTGIIGLALLLAWTSTRHVFWYRNENLLLANPLALFLAVLAPLSLWRPRFARAAAGVAMVIAALSALALVAKLVPGFTQNNLPLILLLAPANLVIALGLWRRAKALT